MNLKKDLRNSAKKLNHPFIKPAIPMKSHPKAKPAENPVNVHSEPDSVKGKGRILRESK